MKQGIYSLRVEQGPDQGTTYSIQSGVNTIGRGETCTVQLHDNSVSTLHVELHLTDEKGMIIFYDLHSRNGVFINDEKLMTGAVHPGDKIRLGGSVIVLEQEQSPEVVPKPSSDHDVYFQKDDSSSRTIAALDTVDADLASEIRDEQESATLQRKLTFLLQLPEILIGTEPLNSRLQVLLDRIMEEIKSQYGCILRISEGSDAYQIAATRSLGTEDPGRIVISETIVKQAIERRHGILASDALRDQRFKDVSSISALNLHAILAAPCISHDVCWGVIFLSSGAAEGFFSQRDLNFLTGLANQVALAMENDEILSRQLKREVLAEIGEFVSGIAHHIKNLLFGFSTARTMIAQALDRNILSDVKKLWPILTDSLHEMENLVSDLIFFSKNRKSEKQSLIMNEILQNCLTFYGYYLQENGITVDLDLVHSMPSVFGDSAALQRVILNLLSNAVDALAETENPTISISSSVNLENNSFFFSIEDNGAGILPEHRKQLFQFLFSTKGDKGTGFGLYISREIIREHGGDITVRSEPGRGTTFDVYLPLLSDQL